MLDRRFISLLIAGTLILALIITLFILLVVHIRRRENRYFLERRRLLMENLQEGERMMSQIAKEVHDNIGQLLHLLYMTLDKIEKTPDKENQLKLIAQARQLTDNVIFNADNVSHSLNSDYIKKRGLCNLLRDDIELIGSSAKITCSVEFTGEIKAYYPDKELLIYRIAQEAIHNALKHSGASMLNVYCHSSGNFFRMEIKDNGKGFNMENAIKRGIGLSNMKERACLLCGDLEIIAAPGAGCRVSLTVKDIMA